MIRYVIPRRPVCAAAMAVALISLSACGGGSSARDEAVDRAVEEGLGRDVAECLVDGTIEEFGEEALADDYEGTPEQLDKTFEIMDACLFGE